MTSRDRSSGSIQFRSGMACLLVSILLGWFVHPADPFWQGAINVARVVLDLLSIGLCLRGVRLAGGRRCGAAS